MMLMRAPYYSQVLVEQRKYRRAGVQGALHWTFPAISQPQIRGILRQMEERSFELRLCFPQVCLSLESVYIQRDVR